MPAGIWIDRAVVKICLWPCHGQYLLMTVQWSRFAYGRAVVKNCLRLRVSRCCLSPCSGELSPLVIAFTRFFSLLALSLTLMREFFRQLCEYDILANPKCTVAQSGVRCLLRMYG